MATTSLEIQLEELLSEDPASAMERERSTFDEIAAPFGHNLVFFGAGGTGRAALRSLRRAGIEPMAFTDNSAALWGTEIDGVRVLSPADAARQFGRSATFVVTVLWRSFSPIREQLVELSCLRVVPFLPLFWKHPIECLPHALVDLPHKVLSQKDDVWKAFALLSDDKSRREYVAQLRLRLLSDFDSLQPPSIHDQYFPDDLFALVANEVFVDCGAFNGDTIRAIIKRRMDFGRIVALEPDPINFERLEEYLRELPNAIRDKISPRRLAVGAAKSNVRFETAGTIASRASDQGELEVECDALDDILGDCAPTYVKMDVEGAELDALSGARRIMHQNSVLWALCVYHKFDDLWRVPLFISTHTQGYHFFLRKYTGDSVIYAIPRERLAS